MLYMSYLTYVLYNTYQSNKKAHLQMSLINKGKELENECSC